MAVGGGPRRWRLVRARRDAVPASTRRFMRRARQRRVRAALPWLVGLAAAAVVGLGAWIAYGTSVLGVEDVRVTGVHILSVAEVEQAVGVPAGAPLAGVDLDGVAVRVAALAAVDTVEVDRDWPHTLVVTVVERTPYIVVPQGKRFVLVDDEGVVFDTVAEPPGRLPLVRLAQPGPGDLGTRAALQVVAALTPELRKQLVAVVVDGPASIRLDLRDERQVLWGDAAENDTKARAATALLGRDGQTIDVRAPDVVSIR